MQGYTCMERPVIVGKLSKDVKKKDPRRILMRATVSKDEAGEYVVTPAKNQSSGLFGVIQKTNCMAVMPEGLEPKRAGDTIECFVLDVPEEVVI